MLIQYPEQMKQHYLNNLTSETEKLGQYFGSAYISTSTPIVRVQ